MEREGSWQIYDGRQSSTRTKACCVMQLSELHLVARPRLDDSCQAMANFTVALQTAMAWTDQSLLQRIQCQPLLHPTSAQSCACQLQGLEFIHHAITRGHRRRLKTC